jgi:hypothetical protein
MEEMILIPEQWVDIWCTDYINFRTNDQYMWYAEYATNYFKQTQSRRVIITFVTNSKRRSYNGIVTRISDYGRDLDWWIHLFPTYRS